MCILIVMRGFHGHGSWLIGGNRDERTDRKASPPGMWLGQRRRVLSPRDRQAGGTWLAVDERCAFAGITNLAGVPPVPDAPSRGHLVHTVLDHDDLDAGLAEVRRRVRADAYSGFQLVVGHRDRLVVLHHARGVLTELEWDQPVLVVTNEHEPGQLAPRGLALAAAPALMVDARRAALLRLLRDRGGDGQHAICKHGDRYATVSSSLLTIPNEDPAQLSWLYAAGPPDVTEFRDYGNLARRLRPDFGAA